MTKEQKKIMNRIDRLDRCIHELEATANNFYTPEGEGLTGWNLLLGVRDKIEKFKEKEWTLYDKLEV